MKKIYLLIKLWFTSLFLPPPKPISLSSDFPKELKEKLIWLKPKVFRAALAGIPLDSFLKQWENSISQFEHKLIGDLKIQAANFKAEIKLLQKKLALSFEEWQINTAAELAEEFKNAIDAVHKKYGVISESIKNTNKNLVEIRASINEFLERYQFVPAKKGFWDSPKAFLVTMSFITCIEFPLVYLSLEKLAIGDSYILILFSFLYSIILAFICEMIGQSVSRQNKPKTIFLLGLSVLFLGSLTYMRTLDPPKIDDSMIQASIAGFEAVMNILSIVFFGLAFAVAIRLHRDRPYWGLIKKEKELINLKETYLSHLDSKPREIKAIEDIYNGKVYLKTLENIAQTEKTLCNLEKDLDVLHATINGKLDLIEAYKEEGINFLNSEYERGLGN